MGLQSSELRVPTGVDTLHLKFCAFVLACLSDHSGVPAVYLASVYLSFFSVLVFRRISNLCGINPCWESDSHPGHQFFFLDAKRIRSASSRGLLRSKSYKYS